MQLDNGVLSVNKNDIAVRILEIIGGFLQSQVSFHKSAYSLRRKPNYDKMSKHSQFPLHLPQVI